MTIADEIRAVLDLLDDLRRERWKITAVFGGMFALGLVMAVLCTVWAAEEPAGHWGRYWFGACALFNAWMAASVAVRLRHHWQGIVTMERYTRAQLDRLRDHQ